MNLKFLRWTRRETGRNFKFTALDGSRAAKSWRSGNRTEWPRGEAQQVPSSPRCPACEKQRIVAFVAPQLRRRTLSPEGTLTKIS
jgi:hypothetical protein